LLLSGHTSDVTSGKVGTRFAENAASLADARRSGIDALDESEAPLEETVQMKPKKKTTATETN
jgi:hypothetical protein